MFRAAMDKRSLCHFRQKKMGSYNTAAGPTARDEKDPMERRGENTTSPLKSDSFQLEIEGLCTTIYVESLG